MKYRILLMGNTVEMAGGDIYPVSRFKVIEKKFHLIKVLLNYEKKI